MGLFKSKMRPTKRIKKIKGKNRIGIPSKPAGVSLKKTGRSNTPKGTKRGHKKLIGKILKTNDSTFSEDGYSKNGRRVVVSEHYPGNYIGANKITKDKPGKRSQKLHNMPLKKKHKSVTVKSGIEAKTYKENKKIGTRLHILDPELIDTGDTLSNEEMRRLHEHKHRNKKLYVK